MSTKLTLPVIALVLAVSGCSSSIQNAEPLPADIKPEPGKPEPKPSEPETTKYPEAATTTD